MRGIWVRLSKCEWTFNLWESEWIGATLYEPLWVWGRLIKSNLNESEWVLERQSESERDWLNLNEFWWALVEQHWSERICLRLHESEWSWLRLSESARDFNLCESRWIWIRLSKCGWICLIWINLKGTEWIWESDRDYDKHLVLNETQRLGVDQL